MWLNNYQTSAHTTALYPVEFASAYCFMKLQGEIGELTEKICLGNSPRDLIHHEIGDCLWYVAEIATNISVRLVDIIHPRDYDYKEEARWSTHQLDQYLHVLCINSGKLNEAQGKILRKTKSFDYCDKNLIISCLKNIIEVLTRVAQYYNSSLEEIATLNLEKLFSRRDRGVLIGEGDKR